MKNDIVLFDSELQVINILWEHGDLEAKDIAVIANELYGWKKTTTYTIIGKCVEKGYIERSYPKYMCHALLTKKDFQLREANKLINNLFDGSIGLLFSRLVSRREISREEIKKLKDLVEQWDDEDVR